MNIKITDIKTEAEELLTEGNSLAETRKILFSKYKNNFVSARDYDSKIGRHCRRYLALHPELEKTAYTKPAVSTVANTSKKTYKSSEVEVNNDGTVNGVVKAPLGTYPTDADILRDMDLDPERYEITSCKKSRWEAQAKGGEVIQMEAFKVSCQNTSRHMSIAEMAKASQKAIDNAKKYIDYNPAQPYMVNAKNGRLGVFQVCDCHFGAYCSKKEHGIDWGPKECKEDIGFITDNAIAFLKNEPVDSLIIAMTGDALNSDTITHTTAHGTQQFDGLLHHSELVKEYFYMMCDVIDKFSNALKIKINVLHTVGNHDTKTVYDLIMMLRIRYDNDPNVVILDELNTRKYREYGNSLLVFTHGQDEGKRVVNAPLNEAPAAVGRTKMTYIISEHFHQYKLIFDGRTVHIVGSTIAPPGTWTKNSAYVGGRRGGQLLIFDKKYCLTTQQFLPVLHDEIDDFVVNCENFI